MEWGNDLWDRYEELMKHISGSIDFMEHTSRMNAERTKIEFDYAKQMKRMATRFQLKKKTEYGGTVMSYEDAYNKGLQEINSIALQHESIAENIKQNVIDPTNKAVQDLKKAKTHYQTEFNKMDKIYNKSRSALDNSLKRYKTAHTEMIKADEAYRAAEENRNLARVEVDRHKQYAETRRQETERVKSDYAAQLEQTNRIHNDYYQNNLPKLLNEIQRSDKERTENFAQYLKAVEESESSVMQTITSCLEGIVKCSSQINWTRDSDAILDALRSGYQIPEEQRFIDLDSLQSTTSLDSLNNSQGAGAGTLRSKKQERATFSWFKTKQKVPKQDEDNLGPEQKKKKINKAIKETQNAINAEEHKKNSMQKLMKTYEKDPQSAQAVQAQINEADQKLTSLREELARLEDSLRQVTGGNGQTQGSPNGQLSGSSSTRSSMMSAGPPPQDNKQDPDSGRVMSKPVPPARVSKPKLRKRSDDDDEFQDDEFDGPTTPQASTSEAPAGAAAPSYVGGCIALYGFTSEDGMGLNMNPGDQFYVVVSDNGDGWTLVASIDGGTQGYVPSNYLEIQLY